MKNLYVLLLLFLTATHAYALDGFYGEYGRTDAAIISSAAKARLYRIGAMWNWNRSWFNNGAWHVTGFWDASIAQWHGDSAADNNQTVTDIGIMPVFRYTPKDQTGTTPYLEAGILGLHLISPTFLYTGRKFSTGFQFGHILGFGVRMGPRHQFELGFRYQHVSNADIKLPNSGMDFEIFRVAYWF
ncbi:MAG TPA: acyloxyacyl hydrolase [Gallionellaceae bacterium]|nr:acyloxyacyl hydrolase [Gallionellaceae bacterium]